MASELKSVLPSSVVVKASPLTFNIAGVRTFWKLARNVFKEIRFERRVLRMYLI
jgi:hypothetical protein